MWYSSFIGLKKHCRTEVSRFIDKMSYNDVCKIHSHLHEGQAGHENIVIINCILNAPLLFISILGNGLVLTAIIKTPSIRSASMHILASLVVSDLLVGDITQPLYIVKELTRDRCLDVLWDTVAYSFCGVSLLIITAISVDRFLALHLHIRYAAIVTKFRIKLTLVIIWLANFLLSVVFLWSTFAYHFMIAVVTGICLIISTFSYIRIFVVVRKHQLQIHAQHDAVQGPTAGTGRDIQMLRLKKSFVNTFVFYVILVMCYLPMYILLTLHGISHQPWPEEWNFATTLVFMNSAINPFLYCWRLSDLRTAVVQTARKMLTRNSNQVPN